jgi:hypothetical protein
MAVLNSDAQFIAMYRTLELLGERADRAMLRSLQYSTRELENAAKETDAYNDDTRATRESTVAFVLGHDTMNRAGWAEAVAESLREGHGVRTIQADEANIGGSGYTIVLTAGTDYTQHLELANAGQNAFLVPTMDEYCPRIAERTFRAAGRVFTRAGLDGSDI